MSANDWDDEYCPDADEFDCCEHGVGFEEECEECEEEDDEWVCPDCGMMGVAPGAYCHMVDHPA